MENIATTSSVLLDIIPIEVLEAQLEKHKDNPKVVEAITSHLQAIAAVKERQETLDIITTILNDLILPDIEAIPADVHNFYIPIINQTVPLLKKEVEEVLAANPALVREDVEARTKETGSRVYGNWTLNKVMTQAKAATGMTATRQRKLAVTVNTRDGATITPLGNFRTSKEACVFLNLDTKGDSARRVLDAHHYIVDDYDGSDYLVAE